MSHELVQFCQAVHEACTKINACLTLGDGTPQALPGNLKNALSFLEARTRKAEVRVLILGPLKSGKSTLMNVLAENPLISQINPLPAYPCYVEVSDLDRENGLPVEPEKSFFYRFGRQEPEQVLSLREGHHLLNELLNNFMDNKDDIRYEKVVQKVDFPPAENGLNLVLIDSPGLFFNKKVDETFNYSAPTQQLYQEADVVIFVIRPEQLFFHVVADWLSKFIADNQMRAFILVNASTHSKTQEEEKVINYDQVKNKDRVIDYFLKHVADDPLIVRLNRENNISLHFTDLLDAATAYFQDGKKEAFSQTDSGRAIQVINDYIHGNNLAGKKKESIRGLMQEVVRKGRQYLLQLVQERSDQLPEQERLLEAVQGRIDQHEEELAILQAQSARADTGIRALEARLEGVSGFLETGAFQEHADSVVKELATLQKMGLSTPDREGTDYLPDDNARELIGKVYDMWLSKKYGERTMKTLATAVWTEGVNNAGSLRDNYRRSIRRAVEKFILEAKARIKEGDLRVILDLMNQRDITVPAEEPGEQHEFLRFNNRFSINPLRGFAYTPEDLWGPDGEKIIERGADERILQEERDNFVNYMWGAPWNLKSYFSPQHLETMAQATLIREITLALAQKIPADIDLAGSLAQKAKDAIATGEQRLASLHGDKASIEATIAALHRQREDLEKRSQALDTILLNLLQQTVAQA